MGVEILGPDPFVQNEDGHFQPRVATIFPAGNTLVTLPGIHATQRQAYVEKLNQQRSLDGLPAFEERSHTAVFASAVDLIIQRDAVYIRPDPQQIVRSLQADHILQQAVPKQLVRFLLAGHAQVYEAIKGRGECWRITPRPISRKRVRETIENSRMGIGEGDIYYHSPSTGTRLLTYENFCRLADLSDKKLQDQLIEIQHYSRTFNRFGNREVDFFIAHQKVREPLQKTDFSRLSAPALRSHHSALGLQFASLVPTALQNDDLDNPQWAQRMLDELQPLQDDNVLEEERVGLAPEFYRHILWLPGGRIEDNEFIFDPVFDQEPNGFSELGDLRDDRARALILNYVRDYPDLEYINVGRVNESLALDRPLRGRRDVYVIQLKRRSKPRVIVKMLRFQKWDVRSHLDDGKDLLAAMIESEEYTEYILDRRLGCRRLGMSLPEHLFHGRVGETYDGEQDAYRESRIWRPYFERDYFKGSATDKIPEARFEVTEFAFRFARLMGRAAASDMIVGRWDEDRDKAYFDDGDEVLIEGEDGLPCDLMVTHHTGAFAEYQSDLTDRASDYAEPINKRIGKVPDPQAFANAYLDEFINTFSRIQEDYRRHRGAFDSLFGIRPSNRHGSFRYRWERVLKRLDRVDVAALAVEIQAKLDIPGET